MGFGQDDRWENSYKGLKHYPAAGEYKRAGAPMGRRPRAVGEGRLARYSLKPPMIASPMLRTAPAIPSRMPLAPCA